MRLLLLTQGCRKAVGIVCGGGCRTVAVDVGRWEGVLLLTAAT